MIMNSPTKKPLRKVYLGWISSGVTVVGIAAVVMWVLPEFMDINITEGAAMALAGFIVALITGATTYQAKNNPGDFNHRTGEGAFKEPPDPTPVLKREKIN